MEAGWEFGVEELMARTTRGACLQVSGRLTGQVWERKKNQDRAYIVRTWGAAVLRPYTELPVDHVGLI